MAQVLVLATLQTKKAEADFLVRQLIDCGVSSRVVDISLQSNGEILDGVEKRYAMDQAALNVLEDVAAAAGGETEVVLGIGGGTGGEIAFRVLRALPITFPKILVTTLPFDPRAVVADNSIILVPTLADIAGLNAILREVLENAALIAAGLCRKERKGELVDVTPSIGITALGATDGAVAPLVHQLSKRGQESTVFHSNGYGGAAFARFAANGAFNAIIDLTPHELTRIHLAGAHVDMPERFVAGSDLPRIVLPGALNFIGLGQKTLVQSEYLSRPHYEHSGFFTHVKVTDEEMKHVCQRLAESLNRLNGPCAMIVPMGGFSHQDRPGGPIEDPELREVCFDTLKASLNSDIQLLRLDAHLFAPEVTNAILETLNMLTSEEVGPCMT